MFRFILWVLTAWLLLISAPAFILWVPILAVAFILNAIIPRRPESTWDELERERRAGLHGERAQREANARFIIEN